MTDALTPYLDETATTLCTCWRLTRRDGQAFGFTDHDRPLMIAGTQCEPESGFTASEARSSLGLVIDSVEVEGALSSLAITEADIAAGRYDGASVEIYMVNWRHPEAYRLVRKATLGEIKRSDGAFSATLQSFAEQLSVTRGRFIRRGCDAELGDDRCGRDVDGSAFRGTGAVASLVGSETLVVSGLGGFVPGWFGQGSIDWTAGERDGTRDRIVEHAARGGLVSLTLWPRTGPAVAPGDTFVATAGCDKSFSTCKTKFENELNFRGFPHLPGNDEAYAYVTDERTFDGGPIIP